MKFGSYLIIPFKYDEDSNFEWLKKNGIQKPLTTMDINEAIKQTINAENTANVTLRYQIPVSVLEREILGICDSGTKELYVRRSDSSGSVPYSGQETDDLGTDTFEFLPAYIYIFHTQVAFFCLGITYEFVEILKRICNPGYADRHALYYYRDKEGELCEFSLDDRIIELCGKAGLYGSFKSGASVFLEAYTYTTAVRKERFATLEEMRQITFNLHLMSEPDVPVEDESEEDVRYVYAVKDQYFGTYRWGCCVSSQTVSYVVADNALDIKGEMDNQAEDGVPIVLLALYQKYTCLRFTELLAIMDKKKVKRLRWLRKQMLEFRAYGTISPANISRWHNVKKIYQHVIETNGIPEAINDTSNALNMLAEHQKEIETARNDTVVGIITIFGIVSILASMLTIIQILSGGGQLEWLAAIISCLSIVFIVILVIMWQRND